jgi:membrane protease subunit HflK
MPSSAILYARRARDGFVGLLSVLSDLGLLLRALVQRSATFVLRPWRASAWNESGGGKEPWKNRPRPEEGPPDLDDIVRNLQAKLKALFGGGKPPETNDEPAPSVNWGAIVGALAALWSLTGFYVVDAGERAVVTRFGSFSEIASPGINWHIPWPVERRVLVNTEEFVSFADSTRMLTQDEALVEINLAVQYRRKDPVQYLFSVADPEKTLGEVSESAIREIVGQSTMDAVLEKGRQEVAVRTKDLVQRTLDQYKTGLEVISVNLQDVRVPEQVAPSQKDAIKAREDKERFSLEAQAYANNILPNARGTAQQSLEDAAAYRSRVMADSSGESARFIALASAYAKAPGVTRQRLYFETMEQVYGQSAKVIVDSKAGNNMLYLPLDKLVERSRASAPAAPSSGSAMPRNGEVTVTPVPASEEPDVRSRGSR